MTVTGPTTISTGTTSNVYSKAEVDQTFANLIDSAPVALNTLKELASALNNDTNYAATVQTQLSNKADKADTYTKTATQTEINSRIAVNNSEQSAVYATQASLSGKQDTLSSGTVVANTNSGPILSGNKVKGVQGLDGITVGGTAELLTLSGTSLAPKSSPTFTGTLNADKVSITSGGLGTLALETTGRIKVGSAVETPKLWFPGTDASDSIVIQNNLGSEVARFYNDYRCTLSGDTTILGNGSVSGTLYSSGPVTCNQTLKVLGDTTVEGARLNVSSNLTNTQIDGLNST